VAALVFAPGVAHATFGSVNGVVDFTSSCTGVQQIFWVNPTSPPSPETCANYTGTHGGQQTAGGSDSEAFFTPNGSTVYFSSNRSASLQWQIYSITTVTNGNAVDGATTVTTPPSGSNDYGPTIDGTSSYLAFIRCASTCSLMVGPIGGPATAIATTAAPATPNVSTGATTRPEFDPVDNAQIIYGGSDGHLHLVKLSLTPSPAKISERDLSSESGIGAGQTDEFADWNALGTKLVFDSNRPPTVGAGHRLFLLDMTQNPVPAAALVWATDPGNEIEPIFSPDSTNYVWAQLGAGQQVVDYQIGSSWSSATTLLSPVGRSINGEPAWQPTGSNPVLPEVHYAVLLPIAGIGVAALVLTVQRRRRRSPVGA
jgi:hypothetical protein